MIEKSHKKLSSRRQSDLLALNRSSFYYKPQGESKENLQLMDRMDKLYLKYPTYGVIRMQDELTELGYQINHKRVRRLMRKMGLEAIYPKKNLSRLGKAKYIQPYLLRDLKIAHPNQVWAIDISYIPMKRGFMYLTAVIDLYSRFLVGWQLSNSLEKENQTALLHDCIARYGSPEIINSDQGSQYTTKHWIETLKEYEIKISMDGKGRAIDNVYIERFFRTIKQDYIYLNPAKNGLELSLGIKDYIKTYNHRRHQGIGRIKPIEKYKQVAGGQELSTFQHPTMEVMFLRVGLPASALKYGKPSKRCRKKGLILNKEKFKYTLLGTLLIRQVDEQWSGTILATLILNRKQRKFYRQQFDCDELEAVIQNFISYG